MTEQKLLRGKVAEILGQYRIAINIGKNDGVKEGMEFVVLGEKSILDPDSRKKLGAYNYSKARVQVEKIEEHYSIATTKSTETTTMSLSLEDFLFKRPTTTREVLSSKVTLEREVVVGDVVVQVKKE